MVDRNNDSYNSEEDSVVVNSAKEDDGVGGGVGVGVGVGEGGGPFSHTEKIVLIVASILFGLFLAVLLFRLCQIATYKFRLMLRKPPEGVEGEEELGATNMRSAMLCGSHETAEPDQTVISVISL